MRTIVSGVIAAGIVLLASNTQSLAIEGLRMSVQCSDVVLGWPSNPGETFIIQRRADLNPGTPWVTLADWLPADWTTNWTVFVDSNRVECVTGGTNNFTGGGSGVPPLPDGASRLTSAAWASEPMVKPADGSGLAVPLCLYPPGTDLSGFVILDPSTGEWASGAGYIIPWPASSQRLRNSPQPMDDGPGGDTSAPDPGFYRVVRDGVHIVGMTNDMTLSGTVTFPVEAGNASGNLVSLSLTEDGTPVNGSSAQTPPFLSPLQMTVDTTMMNNGVHQLSGSARWEDEDGGSYEADSDPIQVNVQNEISFPNWMGTFGSYDFGYGDSTNLLLIEAQSAHTNADFYIDVYDSQNNYIGTFQGNTPDGSIEVAWDLIGPYGETHYSDGFFSFVVTTVFNDPMTASAAPPLIYRFADPWLGYGAFVIAAQHAFDNILGSEDLYAEIDGFVGMAGSYGVMPPPDADGHAFAIHFEPDPAASSDWAAFRSALFHPLARNLIYFGHGGPNGLGYHQANTNLSIRATEIGARLGTMPATTNQHRFRLVLVDGCSTAKGKLPEAFGIIHTENVPGINYYNASVRPSAFGGWTADKYVGILSGGVNYDHIHFIQWIQYYLALGDGIHDAVVHAGGMPDTYGLNTSQFKVYGYWDLSFWAFNY